MSQVALITGASGGIGQSLVKTFTDSGYAVIATDIALQPSGMVCEHFIRADLFRTVEDKLYAEEVFADIKKLLNNRPLKAIIHNAAIQILGGVERLVREDWHVSMNVNLLAPFFWTQAFLSELETAQGCILNISSIHARLTKANFIAYSTSKAALSGMTRAMAIELGNRVRVNAIEPAAIDTPMLRAGFEKAPEDFQRLERFHPSNCIGTPEKLGQLARMIIEADSLFLNGAVIPFDGGIGACLSDPGSEE